MFSKFFINRPIFASVLSIVTVLAGSIALFTLPVAQYPDITPPTVEVSAAYPGANAQVVADTVAAPIEQQVNGVEGMMYMSSQCTNDGAYTLTVTFKPGSDLNISQVLVQNRVSLAEPTLPDLVKRRGIAVKKKSPNVLMIVNLFAADGSRNSLELSNYATIQIRDELSRLPGVGDITYLGQRDYSMRLWLDPQKMASYNVNAQDIIGAVQAQNVQVAAGQIGQPPTPKGQVTQYIITTLGRLHNDREFGDIVLRNNGNTLLYLKDVATVTMGAQSYDQTCTLDGRPSVALSVYQLPGSNALDVAKRVRERMRELKDHFPPGYDYDIVYDTTPFISESITEVFETLFDAIVLVAFVVLLFLQNWRSTLIPLIAVPVAVVGTFAVMAAIGFSLNNLTLFGLVLAIGIVVDDAIVVVEAVEHHIEHGLSPREASLLAMEQVSGPVIAIALVLSAVFIPCAFISGIVGQFFRQFALTIAVSTVISAFNSLTLSPALSALLLKRREKGVFEPLPWFIFVPIGAWLGHKLGIHYAGPVLAGLDLNVSSETLQALRAWGPILLGAIAALIVGVLFRAPINGVLGAAFRGFNRLFDYTTSAYTRSVSKLLYVCLIVVAVYGGLLALTYWSFTTTPTGFIPQQDKGYLLVNVQMPDAASVTRTNAVVQQIEEIALKTPGVKHTVAISGQSILLGANASNFGSLFLMLEPFEKRGDPSLSAEAIATALQERFQAEVPKAIVNVFGAPPVEGLGTAGGFKIIVQDTGDGTWRDLQRAAEDVVANGEKDDRLEGLFSSFRADTPWVELQIDRAQAKDRGVSIDDIRTTLESTLGPYYINDFNRFGRTWQVNVQAQESFRQKVGDVRLIQVRSNVGAMVPFGGFTEVKNVSGPVLIMRYNMYPAAAIHADAGPNTSSGQAIAALEDAAREDLPVSMRTEWTELAYLQLQTGNTAMWVFLLAVVLVFLVLAAQYESWSLPLAVILVVPMCLLCAIVGVILSNSDINIFTQIGFLVLVGLACKNAILIVEFAKAQREEGKSRAEATLAACQLRLRPIIMTSFAFILGVVPLMVSEGAGAEMRRTLGVAVFAGMLGVTLFGIFLTPVFYYVIQWLSDLRPPREPEEDEEPFLTGHVAVRDTHVKARRRQSPAPRADGTPSRPISFAAASVRSSTRTWDPASRIVRKTWRESTTSLRIERAARSAFTEVTHPTLDNAAASIYFQGDLECGGSTPLWIFGAPIENRRPTRGSAMPDWLDIPVWLIAFLIALPVGTFVEYWAHCIMHAWLLKKKHAEHHRDGWGQGWLGEFFDYAVGTLIIMPVGFLYSVEAGIGFVAGALVYAAFAAYAHQLQHEKPELCFWMVRPVHYLHHYRHMWKTNFGISFDIWDRVFGTYQKVEWTRPPRGSWWGLFKIHWFTAAAEKVGREQKTEAPAAVVATAQETALSGRE